MRSSSWNVKLSWVLAVASYATFVWRASFAIGGARYFSLFDDAMISMRYARNLAAGEGVTWNPGSPPVEGYTNPLWTLVMAVPHLLPLSETKTSLFVMVAGAGLLLAHLAVIGRLAARLGGGDRAVRNLALPFVAFYYPLAYWTLRGLEVGLLVLLLGAAVLLSLRLAAGGRGLDVRALGAVAAASVLVRMDALVPLLALLVPWGMRGHAPGARKKVVAAVLIGAGLSLLGLTVFRWFYFGDLLPNTYYLKLAGIPLGERLARGAATLASLILRHLPVALLLVALLLLRERSRIREHGTVTLLALFGGQCAYSLWVGGDAWEWMHYANRFISLGMPALLVLAAVAVVRMTAGARSGRLRPALAAAVLLTLNGPAWVGWWKEGGYHVADDAAMVRTALAVRAATDREARIAVTWAGAFPYFADRECVDLLGKCDRRLARNAPSGPFYPGHNKWDFQYSIGELHPDLILQVPEEWEGREFWRLAAKEGYERLPNGIWIDPGSPHLRRSALRALRAPRS